jgi:hypothetical protein
MCILCLNCLSKAQRHCALIDVLLLSHKLLWGRVFLYTPVAVLSILDRNITTFETQMAWQRYRKTRQDVRPNSP